MDEAKSCNRVFLRGAPAEKPVPSHRSGSEQFYVFPLETLRLSGTADRINVVIRSGLLENARPSRAGLLDVEGELRTYNNRSGQGSRLVITVFARTLGPAPEPTWENRVELEGTLCKVPNHRMTPLGREITDVLLAVNRPYGRSDYLPCILWGQTARQASAWDVGTRVRLEGRIQSRSYIKVLDGVSVERTAYEVSASRAEVLG